MLDYRDQVEFARKHIKEGNIQRIGEWTHGWAWGKIWAGRVCGYSVQLQTIGDGPMMRPGSFFVRCIGRDA